MTDKDEVFIVYLKLINGQDIIAISEYAGKVKGKLYTVIQPTLIIPDYDGHIDMNDLYLEDWLPGADTDLKYINIRETDILSVLHPSDHALNIYADYLEKLSISKPKFKLNLIKPKA